MAGGNTELAKLEAEYERVKKRAEIAKAKAKEKLDRYKARKADAVRRHDAKRKIIAGGFLFKLAADGDQNAQQLVDRLHSHINGGTARTADQRAFDDWEWPKTKASETSKTDETGNGF